MPKTARRTTPLRVHPEDIKAMIRKTGVGVTELSVSLGYAANAISTALKRPWPAVEADLATHFGVKPQSLFPDRYDAAGHPLSFPASKRSRAKARRLRQKSLSA